MHQVSYVFNTVDIRFMSASVSGCSREGGGGGGHFCQGGVIAA